MIRVTHLQGAMWTIRSTYYNKRLHLEAKRTPGLHWEPTATAWVGYIDAAAACSRRIIEAGEPVDTQELDAANAPQTRYASVLNVAVKGLRPYQQDAVSFLLEHGREGCILADDLGLGKTACALRAARALKEPTVVIAPAFAAGVWRAETEKWWNEVHLVQLEGLEPNSRVNAGKRAVVYLLNYAIAHAWLPMLPDTRVLILDEAHMLVGSKARRSSAIRDFARRTTWRVGLTGTPMTNRPKDLFNLVDTLSEGRFGRTAFSFYMRHCDAKQERVTPTKVVWKFDGKSNIDELHARLQYFMLRRTKSDVGMELPARTRQVLMLDVKRRYVVAGGTIMSRGHVHDASLRKALDLAADGKLDEVVALVRNHIAEGHKVVVFCYRRATTEWMAAQLGGVFIHGGISVKERDKRIAAQPDVLCATIDVTAGAISLTYADVGVYAELTYEPHELVQTEGRIARFGQSKPVLFQYCIARGTADELVLRSVIDKLATMEEVIGHQDEKLKESLQANRAKTTREALDRIAAVVTKRIAEEEAQA